MLGSGTSSAAEKLNLPPADGLCELKAQLPGVGSKAELVLEINPVPVMLRKPLPWKMIVEENRSKVNPPTLQRAGLGVDGSKVHGAEKAAGVLTAMNEKSPSAL